MSFSKELDWRSMFVEHQSTSTTKVYFQKKYNKSTIALFLIYCNYGEGRNTTISIMVSLRTSLCRMAFLMDKWMDKDSKNVL